MHIGVKSKSALQDWTPSTFVNTRIWFEETHGCADFVAYLYHHRKHGPLRHGQDVRHAKWIRPINAHAYRLRGVRVHLVRLSSSWPRRKGA